MNRALFYVEPLVMHNRPFHYWAWLSRGAAMARHLAAAGWDFRVAVNQALAVRAAAPRREQERDDPSNGQDLPCERLAVFGQEELRAPYGAPNVAILDGLHHERWPEVTVQAHAAVIRERLGAFEPDVIVTWTPSAALRAAFPDALVLHTENGMFSRAPYPSFQFFDPHGFYDRSVPALEAAALRARVPAAEERAFLERWRTRLAEQHRATTPFAGLERSMRRHFPRLALLPLQFGGEAGFDLNGPFRNQGEYLFHVLERLPDGVGVIVSEHPTAHWLGDRIDDETQKWLRLACPQATFVPLSAGLHSGQTLVPHVDTVICVSSSIGWQALFWGKELICPGQGHLAAWAHHHDPTAVGRAGAGAVAPDGALAWMLTRYFVRDAQWLLNAEWLPRFFEQSLARWRAGRRGLDFFDPAEPLATLERSVLETAGRVEVGRELSTDPLENGRFEKTVTDRTSGWLVLEQGGARLSFERVPAGLRGAGAPSHAARIHRASASEAPTLFLQRIRDARRLAGMTVSVSFEARGSGGATLESYLYVQPGAGGAPPRGTAAQEFQLGPEWRRCSYVATVPDLKEGEALGAGHHVELVLRLPPGGAPLAVDVTDVRIGPPDWREAAA